MRSEEPKKKGRRVKITWDAGENIDRNSELAGLVMWTDDTKSIAGQLMIDEAHRYPSSDFISVENIPLTNLDEAKRQAIQRIGTQVLELMPLIIDGEVTTSGDSSFHLDVTRTGAHYTIDLEVPTVIGEKGDKGDKGDTGDTGATGATGAAGADGSDCDCPPPPTTQIPTPTVPEGGTADQTKCNTAEGVIQQLRAHVSQVHTAIQAGDAIQLIASIILAGIIAAITEGAAIPLLITAIGAFIDFILNNMDDSLTALGDDAYWDHLRCAVYCAIDNSDIDSDKITAITAAIRADTYTSGSFNAPAMDTTLANFIEHMPAAQVRTWALQGQGNDADCSGCNCDEICPHIADFHASLPGTLGTETDRADDWIEVAAEYYSGYGLYVAQIDNGYTDDNCCHVKAIDIISGTGFNAYCIPCGTSTTTAISGLPDAHEAKEIWVQWPTALTVRFHLG